MDGRESESRNLAGAKSSYRPVDSNARLDEPAWHRSRLNTLIFINVPFVLVDNTLASRVNRWFRKGKASVVKKAVTTNSNCVRCGIAATLIFASAVTSNAASAAATISLTGSVAANCAISVTADPAAANLTLTGTAQHVTVGTLTQNCNKKAGYTIVVTSANCASPTPAGAKLVGTTGGEKLSYSVESHNPTTGGSQATILNLLASACTSQNARDVAGTKISAETSTVFVNFTGDATLGADTYQDTLTFTMTVK